MKCEAIEKLKDNICTPFITVIGRSGAGVPVNRIEAIVEFNNEIATKIFREGLKDNKVVKTLLDENKIKSIIILETGEIHPSTFHYTTLKQRCSPFITLVTTVGCDGCGINADKINLIINYKNDNSNQIVDELLTKYIMRLTYEDSQRTKSLIICDSKVVYPCTFNFTTIRKRIHLLRGDEYIPDDDEDIEKD